MLTFKLFLLRWLIANLGISNDHLQLAASGYVFNARRLAGLPDPYDGPIRWDLAEYGGRFGANWRREFRAAIITDKGHVYEANLTYVYIDETGAYMEFGPINAIANCTVVKIALLTEKGASSERNCEGHLVCGDSFVANFRVSR